MFPAGVVKDAVWSVAEAWDKVPQDNLKNGWHELWPAVMFSESEGEDEADFHGFHISQEKRIVSDFIDYSKGGSCTGAEEVQKSDTEQ